MRRILVLKEHHQPKFAEKASCMNPSLFTKKNTSIESIHGDFSMVIRSWQNKFLKKIHHFPKSPSFAKCRSQSPCPWEACSSARSCHLQAIPPDLDKQGWHEMARKIKANKTRVSLTNIMDPVKKKHLNLRLSLLQKNVLLDNVLFYLWSKSVLQDRIEKKKTFKGCDSIFSNL